MRKQKEIETKMKLLAKIKALAFSNSSYQKLMERTERITKIMLPNRIDVETFKTYADAKRQEYCILKGIFNED